MALIPLNIPAGVYRNGTEYQSKGRYFDANLVRWFEGTLRPLGGWRKKSESQMTGKCRGLITWRDNSADRWIAAGTHSKLYAMNEAGTLKDITPTGFTAGSADGVSKVGYGYGPYGAYAYGVARPDTGSFTPATTWSLDTWGEYLVGCSNSDGKLYEWQLGFSTPTLAAAITNAPTGNEAVMTTSERFVFALGAGGNTRKVAWCDQEDNTVWTPAADNQAGDFELTTVGDIKCGKRVRGLSIIFTDVDVHTATYVGLPYVYSFEKVGSACGVISSQAVAAIETAAIWMSRCGNCAAFDREPKMLQCIAQGMGEGSGDPWGTIKAGDLGYCEIFDFKCAASRTCSAWVAKEEGEDEEGEEYEEGEEEEEYKGQVNAQMEGEDYES